MIQLALLCATLLVGSGCYSFALTASANLATEQGRAPRCDVILVPGCPALPDGSPSTCIRRRVDAAVAALREGAGDRLLFSGAAAHNHVNEAQTMAAYARSLGIREERILVEPMARHTGENVRYAALLLVPRGWRRVLIVTDALQMPYALLLAEGTGLRTWGRLAHPALPARVARTTIARDRLEPVPGVWWF